MNKRQYTLAASVYMAEIERDVILLDLAQQQKDQQYVFIKGGALLFPAILMGQDRASVVSSLAEKHGFSQEAVGQGIDTCLHAGWLVREPSNSFPCLDNIKHWQINWLPLRVEAFILLQRIHRFIQQNAFLTLVQAIMGLPAKKDWKQDRRGQKIIRAVNEAARMFREPMTCLPQSLAMCWMLRKRGIAAQVAIRVQQDPLMGHMIVVNGDHVISWKPGLHSITTYDHFLAATILLFHSGHLDRHYRRKGEE